MLADGLYISGHPRLLSPDASVQLFRNLRFGQVVRENTARRSIRKHLEFPCDVCEPLGAGTGECLSGGSALRPSLLTFWPAPRDSLWRFLLREAELHVGRGTIDNDSG